MSAFYQCCGALGDLEKSSVAAASGEQYLRSDVAKVREMLMRELWHGSSSSL